MAARKGKRWIYWLMIGLLLLGFGGWFTGGAGSRSTSIASVGGLEIAAQDYANALRNRLRQLEEQTGQTLTTEQAQALGIDRGVLSQLVAQRALDAEARRLGLSVGDIRVAESVRAVPAFQSLDGQFDRQAYREALRRNGLDEQEFETSLREDSTRTILQAAVLGGVPEPETFAEVIAAYANERRDVTWATLGPEAVAVLPDPEDGELLAYYETHPEKFTAPEVRRVSYAWITPEMIQDGLAIDDADVQALYDERINEFVQDERRLVERLVFPTDEAAQEASARLDAGESTFEDLVEERGLQLSDVDLGDVSRDDLDDAAEAVFAAEPGSVVGPLPSSLGPSLFRLNAVLAADEISLEEAAPDLRAELANDRARDVIVDLVPEVEDLVAGGATVEDLAERTDLEFGAMAWSEGQTEGPAAYQEFRESATALQEDDSPQIVELGDGGIVALRLDSVTPPDLRPFNDIEAEVRASWEIEALQKEIGARAEAAAQAVAEGASFEERALLPRTEAGLTRRDAVEGTSSDFIETLFQMAPGDVRALPTENGALVLRLDAVEPADAENENVAAERAAIAAQVAGSLSQDILDAFARQLQMNTELSINDQAVASVNAQLN